MIELWIIFVNPDFTKMAVAFLTIYKYIIMNQNEIHLDLLRRLESNPECTQRELSKEMGVSLGKINYCIKKLIEKGLIKFSNFKNSDNKASYAYFLTPKGIEEKGKLTFFFLKIKIKEYKILEEEIGKLKYDANRIKHNNIN